MQCNILTQHERIVNQPIKEGFSLFLHQMVGDQGVSNISKTIVMFSVEVGGNCFDAYILQ